MSEKSVKTAAAYGLPVWSADTPITAESLTKLSEGIASAMENLERRLSTAGGKINGPLEVAGGLTRAGNTVYDTGNKPTAADVGALPVGVSQITTPENFAVDPNAEDIGWASGLDIKNKGVRYGCFGGLGNSRTNTFSYLFMGREYDDANAFRWHHNGKLSVGDDVLRNEDGNVMEHGARVYSPNNLPDRARVQNENEINLANGFAKDDGQVYINNRDAVKPIKRYSLCNGQGTKTQAELSAKALYEGSARVYSQLNPPSTDQGRAYRESSFTQNGVYFFWSSLPFTLTHGSTITTNIKSMHLMQSGADLYVSYADKNGIVQTSKTRNPQGVPRFTITTDNYNEVIWVRL